MRKRKGKKILSLVLAGMTCVSMLGCSGGTIESLEWQQDSKATDIKNENQKESQKETTATGMGRYVEKTVLELDMYGGHGKLQKMSDGSLMYFDTLRKYISKDNGETWNMEEMDWLYQLNAEHFFLDSAISKDGTIFLEYMPYPKNGEITAEEENAVAQMLALQDGTQKSLKLDFTTDSMYMRDYVFGDDGTLFATIHDEKIYEIDTENGKTSEFLNVGEGTYYMQCQNNILLCASVDDIYLFDMDNKKRIEDTVLSEFIREAYGSLESGNSDYYNYYVFMGEENVVYIAGNKGLHRHIIGGSSMEQVIDGNLSSFGDPSHGVVCAQMIEHQEFVVCFSDDKIVKFTYDATIPTVPNNALNVYSLKDSDAIRQAIFAYQTANPDIYVTYEIGMEGEGVTREDALKNLNTRLVDGSGPDVLIMDDMPLDSYIDKGILMDMRDIANQIDSKEGLFTSALQPLYKDEKLYVIPAEIWMPVIADDNDVNISNYQEIADKVEQLRKQNSEKDILEIYTPRVLMKKFSVICASSWKNEDKTLNEEKLREFLIESKRIYAAQMSGTESQRNKELMPESQEVLESMYLHSLSDGSYLMKKIQMLYGMIFTIDDFARAMSVQKNTGFEQTKIVPMNGQSSHVYCPKTMAGINASTKNKDEAETFIQTLLGSEVQELLYTGLPINKKAFEAVTTPDPNQVSADGGYLSCGMSDMEGNSFYWDVYWPTVDQVQLLKEWITSADTPYISDVVLEEAVYTAGEEYMKGILDIDTAMKQILEKTEIYLAE